MPKKNASQKAFQLYLKEIEQYSDLKLTPEEEKELFKRIEKGDAEAEKKLARAHLKLVVKIVNYYAPQSKKLSILDLIQEGNIALYRATELYDWRSDYMFSNFATIVIGLSILAILRNEEEVVLDKNYAARRSRRKTLEKLAKGEIKKEELFKSRLHVLYRFPEEKEEKKWYTPWYAPEEKTVQILKIKNYIQENISEAIKLLLLTRMFSRTEAKEEIRRILK